MRVIDVDSHFYEPLDWLESRFPELAREVPSLDPATLVATTAFGDVISTLPPGVRPDDPMEILPKHVQNLLRYTPRKLQRGLFNRTIGAVKGAWKAEERLAWMDAQGVDVQFVLPTFAFNPLSRVRRGKPELAPELFAAYNTWAIEALADHGDRLIPVTVLDLHTMSREQTLAEMKRVREAGSRSFVFWASPVDDVALSHPDFDWFWAAAEDLGLIPMIHVGAGRPSIDLGWLNNGRPFPQRVLTYLSQLHQIPEVVLTELLLGGVFERHPRLRVLVSELGVDWIPYWLRRIDRVLEIGKQRGGDFWSYPLKPSEYARRQIRVSPLHHDPTPWVLEQLGGDIVVFASDYPHPEGGKDALAVLRKKLEGRMDPPVIERFLGGQIEQDLAA